MSRSCSAVVLFVAASLAAAACSRPQPEPDKATSRQVDNPSPVAVRLVAFNDLHGNLEGPAGTVEVDGKEVDAGGIATMKTYVEQLKQKHPHTTVVSAGDLVGASPLVSAIYHDEPTIDALNQLGLEFSAVGNHEFDDGLDELKRLQDGGCHPDDGCQSADSFAGADFDYLGANVVDDDTDTPVFPSYKVKRYGGIPVAFMGLTLEGVPAIVSPDSVNGLEFRDEVEVIDETAARLQDKGIEAIVVLIHQGGHPTKQPVDINGCNGLDGPIVDIVKHSSPAIDVFVTGHTHRTYICKIDGKLVTSAKSYGRLLTEIDMTLDPQTHDVLTTDAVNHVIKTNKVKADPDMSALVKRYAAKSAKLGDRSVGSITSTISHNPDANGQSPLGGLIADAQLEATRLPGNGNADMAFMNPGGIRADLTASDGKTKVAYKDLHRVQPFGSALTTMTLTGDQIHDLLESQWSGAQPTILQVSRGFKYAWSASGTPGDHVSTESIELDGQTIDPDKDYRVTVNSFLASGGDGFTLLKDGVDRRVSISALEALVDFFAEHSPVEPASTDRIATVE